MPTDKVLTAEEWVKLPADDRVDYISVQGQGWVFSPAKKLLTHELFNGLSPEKQQKFQWDRAVGRFERFVL